jgi:hypothetical protein
VLREFAWFSPGRVHTVSTGDHRDPSDLDQRESSAITPTPALVAFLREALTPRLVAFIAGGDRDPRDPPVG